MASLGHEIKIKVDLRPCYVKGKRALFHKWFTRTEVINGNALTDTFAIVEFENGTVREASITDVHFCGAKMDGGA